MMIWVGAGTIVVAGLFSFFATAFSGRLAVRAGMLDVPGRQWMEVERLAIEPG